MNGEGLAYHMVGKFVLTLVFWGFEIAKKSGHIIEGVYITV